MYSFVYTNQFKKDFKRCIKRNYQINLIEKAFEILASNGELPLSYKPHKLSGDFSGYNECHIKPDWLLIW
jgi:mRNA interferase YafQ